jgi:hypothetical protein
VVSDIRELHRAFEEAELHADAQALDALLAADFRSIGEQGYMLDKAQWIGKFADFSYISVESTEIDVAY